MTRDTDILISPGDGGSEIIARAAGGGGCISDETV